MKKKLPIILVAVLVVAGGAYKFVLAKPAVVKKKVDGEVYVLPKDFLINLSGGRFVKLDVALVIPDGSAAPAGGGELITGIAHAASYLGYDKPDSFRRARTRHPIPGEGKTSDGRPCWTPQVLRSWQSRRKIAGNRTPAASQASRRGRGHRPGGLARRPGRPVRRGRR